MKGKLWPLGLVAVALVLTIPSAVAAVGDREVTIGSPPSPFSQNKQNEPAIAMDAGNEQVSPPARTTTSTRKRATPVIRGRARSRRALEDPASTSRSTGARAGPSRPTQA